MAVVKDSRDYGWLVISRAEYEKKVTHDYAGPGTPCHPERPGVWVMGMDETGATCLWTGVTIDEEVV